MRGAAWQVAGDAEPATEGVVPLARPPPQPMTTRCATGAAHACMEGAPRPATVDGRHAIAGRFPHERVHKPSITNSHHETT